MYRWLTYDLYLEDTCTFRDLVRKDTLKRRDLQNNVVGVEKEGVKKDAEH